MGGDYDSMYPELRSFFGTYFNQDLHEYGNTDAEIIQAYSREQGVQKRLRVIANIDALLQNVQSQEQLTIALDDFCSAYYLDPDTQPARAWLERIRQLIKATIDN
jgi:hypothetical protein